MGMIMSGTRKFIGIDPGIQITGWGIVSSKNSKLVHHNHGIIKTNSSDSDNVRLYNIYFELLEVIKENKPDVAIVEKIFVAKNPKSALKLGMARGIAILVCGITNVEVREISPRKVKKVITGSGNAEKTQVVGMISNLLSIEKTSKDASDALGMAIGGLHGGFDNFYDFKKADDNKLSQAINIALKKQYL